MSKSKRAPKEYRRTEIVVAGKGTFPYDMLRYDNCVFRGSEDVARAEHSLELRQIRLERFSYDGDFCEKDRWASFGWDVIEDSGVGDD